MESPEELVSELRSVISAFRTMDFTSYKNDGGSLEELGESLHEIKKKMLPYQVHEERMQAGLRPEEHFFRPNSPSTHDLSDTEPREFFPYRFQTLFGLMTSHLIESCYLHRLFE